MLTLKATSKFRKDYKRMKKRGYDLARLEEIIDNCCVEKLWRQSTETMS